MLNQRHVFISIVVCIFILFNSVSAIEPVSKIVQQPDSPLEITKYNARYDVALTDYNDPLSKYKKPGVKHEIFYQNKSGKGIIAVEMTLINLDVWDETMSIDRATSIVDANSEPAKKVIWTVAVPEGTGFMFLTGIVYISKVRFADGEIWKADKNEIASKLKSVYKDFDVSALD